MNFLGILVRELWHHKSLMRIYLNRTLAGYTLTGRTLDVGCGSDLHYLDFMPRAAGMSMDILEHKQGSTVDFEKDPLPYETGTYDTLIILNVLEHIYHYAHLVGEVHRVLKDGGTLVGYTPFLIRYHPDPHDFFRYTDEALRKILEEGGFTTVRIEPVGEGPFSAALNVFVLSIPRVIRVPGALLALACDRVFIRLRPHARAVYPLGYFFVAIK